MSLLPNLTQSAPGVSLFAPASGGGGGGGGTNNFSTINVSTINVQPSADINWSESLNFQGANSEYLVLISTPSALDGTTSATELRLSAPLSASTVVLGAGVDGKLYMNFENPGKSINMLGANLSGISTINGVAPGGGGGGSPENLTTSSITVAGAAAALGADFQINAEDTNLYRLTTTSTGTQLASIDVGLSGGRNQVRVNGPLEADLIYGSTIIGTTGQISLNPDGADSIVLGGLGAPGNIRFAPTGGGVINCEATTNIPSIANISSLTVSSINGAAPGGGGGTVSTFPGLIVSSPTAAVLTLNGGTNEIVARSDNIATATIWATGAGGLNLSTVTSLNGGLPFVSGSQPDDKPILQSGYVSAVPYTSTILFPVPYNSDKISVMLTATNTGVSSGANPNISLDASFGNNGVSSIGFRADTRDNGSGYNGSFFWMSLPWC
jgi:hypothetical protein